MPIGPQLPAQSSKRKRDQDVEDHSSDEDGPQPAPDPLHEADESPHKTKSGPPIGPTMPPSNRESDEQSDVAKRRRVMGPTAPPAALDERPQGSPNSPPSASAQPQKDAQDESDSSDGGFGPSLPPSNFQSDGPGADDTINPHFQSIQAQKRQQNEVEETARRERDSWMTAPPTQSDLTSRMDPSRVHAKKGFNTARGAKGASSGAGGGISKTWTETPEEKRKRLEDEVMGVSNAPVPSANGDAEGKKSKRKQHEDEEMERKVKEHNERFRSKSLYAQYQDSADKGEDGGGGGKKKKKEQKEDDPSKRGFDWEKDMGSMSKLGSKQKNDMIKRAGNFSSRFGGSTYL